MIERGVEFVGYWLGVTDAGALAVAQGALLGGIILFVLYLALALLIIIVGAIDL